jgi:predicted dinucleotide-binding enzyme
MDAVGRGGCRYKREVKIGIVGAGNIGGTPARRLSALGHDVSVANSRGPQTLSDLVSETGAKAVPVQEAARGADVVVVTIPEGSPCRRRAPASLRDATTRRRRDGSHDALPVPGR